MQEKLVSFYFLLIGIGYLFPFSAMSQPVDYWRLLFDFDVLFYISLVFMYTNMILLVALVFFTNHNSTKSFIWRIAGGFLGQLISLIIVPSAYFLQLDESANFWMVIGCTAFMALVTAFLDSSVIALAGCFPVKCQESLQLGVGVSTLIGCIYRVITKLAFPQTDDGIVESSLVYFYTGAGTIVLCLVAFAAMLSMPLAKRYLNASQSDENESDFESANKPLMDSRSESSDTLISSSAEAVKICSEDDDDDQPESTEQTSLIRNNAPFSKKAAFMKSFRNGLCITFLFLTTLAVWPAMISVIPSFQFPSLNEAQWWPLILLNVFAWFDVLGRFMVPYRFGVTRQTIHYPVLLRLLFIPFLVVLVKGYWPLIQHDAVSCLVTAILGWTNGWCGSLTIILMNESGEGDKEKRFIGTLASFFLNAGLVLGATVGMAVDEFILRHP